jgi:hypothetical protein
MHASWKKECRTISGTVLDVFSQHENYVRRKQLQYDFGCAGTVAIVAPYGSADEPYKLQIVQTP